METLQSQLRALGYQLAVREIYGENTPDYHKLRRSHNDLLQKLYQLEKRS